MTREKLHVGDLWRVKIDGLIEGDRQICAKYQTTVELSAPTDPRREFHLWARIQFLRLLRRSNGKTTVMQ